MKLKSYLVFFLTLIMSITYSYGQSEYYYYKGKKVELEIDKSKIDVFTDIDFELNSLNNLGLKKSYFNNPKRKSNNKKVTIELEKGIKKDEFLSKIKLLTNKKGVRNHSLYYKRKNATPIGTSNIFYVKLKKETDIEILNKISKKHKVTVIHQNKFMHLWYKLQVDNKNKKSTIELSNIFFETGLFEDIDPNFMFNYNTKGNSTKKINTNKNPNKVVNNITNCTNDTNFNLLWGFKNTSYSNIDINICNAWTITEGNGVNIAVLDQGIDMTHNDLNDNLSPLSYDTASGNSSSVFTNNYWHGTHVAGTIAAEKNNNLQVVGVAPKSKIIGVSNQLLVANPILSEELANGINWAVQNGAHIINNSWGDWGGLYYGSLQSSLLENAIINALTNGRNGLGTVMVFSSGNVAPNIDYPANFYDGNLVVGSTEINAIRSTTAAYGIN